MQIRKTGRLTDVRQIGFSKEHKRTAFSFCSKAFVAGMGFSQTIDLCLAALNVK